MDILTFGYLAGAAVFASWNWAPTILTSYLVYKYTPEGTISSGVKIISTMITKDRNY